jgi:hypothetical protein
MVEGDGGKLGVSSLSESSGTIEGSGCMILGEVGAGDTPSIQGRKKENLDRSLAARLNLRSSLMDWRRPTLDLSGVNPSNSLRMCGHVQFDIFKPISVITISLPEGEAKERDEVSLIYCLVHSRALPIACCSNMMD